MPQLASQANRPRRQTGATPDLGRAPGAFTSLIVLPAAEGCSHVVRVTLSRVPMIRVGEGEAPPAGASGRTAHPAHPARYPGRPSSPAGAQSAPFGG